MNSQDTDNNELRSERGSQRASISVDTAKVVQNMLNNRVSLSSISAATGLALRTVQKIRATTEPKNGEMVYSLYQAKKRGPKKGSSNQAQIDAIINHIALNPDSSLQEIKETLNLNISLMTICKILQANNLTRKRVTREPLMRNTLELINKRFEYSRWFYTRGDLKGEKMIFIDEAGFNLSRTPNYGYSPKNSPCIVIHPNQGANITLIAAISIDGVLDFKIIDGACNADIFADYLSSNIWPKILGYDYSLLMDNARFHQSSIVRQTVPGACEINFIPPYSPQLNPIEEVFAEWKSQYSRLRPKTRPEAKEIIAMIGRNMASRSFSNYYNHMIFHLERCFQRLPLQNDG